MELNSYQNDAMRTAIYPIDRGLDYAINGLTGEAGELSGSYAKAIRDDNGYITPSRKEHLLMELGDILWMCAAVARELDTPLEHVAHMNLNKLESRARRGTLKGNGDQR